MSHLFLAIETSSRNCSVALFRDETLLDCIEQSDDQYIHSEKLHVFIRDLFKRNALKYDQLAAVAVSKGPGSYTGLRIGVSAAKGICFPLDIPLIAIPSLHVLALHSNKESDFIIPVLDARRMEVFSAVYDQKGDLIREIQAEIIDENSFAEYFEKGSVEIIGDCVEKIKPELPNAQYTDAFPSASAMGKEIHRKFTQKAFEDLAYFEPFYLKDFVAIKPKKIL
jgi:tRNA threonylcarbamoyladenosine biosynthesis protein TsaB